MKRTVPKLSSNKIHNRRIYGENPGHYAASEVTNLTYGQGDRVIIYPNSSDVVESRVMPTIADEHIFLGTMNGAAADTGVTGQTATNIAARTTATIRMNDDGILDHDDGYASHNSPGSLAWNAAHSEDGTSGGVQWTTTSVANEGIKSDTYTTAALTEYYVEAKVWTDKAMTVHLRTRRGNDGSTVELNDEFTTSGNGWELLRGYYRTLLAAGSNAYLEVMTSGSNVGDTIKVESFLVHDFRLEHSFLQSHDVGWDTGTEGPGIGAFVAIVPSDNTKPWEIDFSTLTLWDDYYIGQITDWDESANPGTLKVDIGAIPHHGDFHDNTSHPYTGWSAYTLPSGKVHYFYDLAWWIKKTGLIGTKTHGDIVNLTLHQYDDVPGGITTETESGSGMFHDDYEKSSEINNLENMGVNTGFDLNGQFKALRLSYTENEGGAPLIEAICAPEV